MITSLTTKAQLFGHVCLFVLPKGEKLLIQLVAILGLLFHCTKHSHDFTTLESVFPLYTQCTMYILYMGYGERVCTCMCTCTRICGLRDINIHVEYTSQ